MNILTSNSAASIAKQRTKEYYTEPLRAVLNAVVDTASLGSFKTCVDITGYISHDIGAIPFKEQVLNFAYLLRSEGFTVEVYENDLVVKLIINWM